MSYGLPYMGCKSDIAKWIFAHLPSAIHFYDLFAGGCSISHAAILSRRYDYIHVNDISPYMPYTFLLAIQGKYADEKRWISHDDFFEQRNKGDMYVDLCFSFGNNADRSYAYSAELEPYKQAAHHAILLDDYSLAEKLYGVDVSYIGQIESIGERYAAWKRMVQSKRLNVDKYGRLQSLERLLRMRSLESLKCPYIDENVTFTALPYDEVEIESNSVLYCDIPYKGTCPYNKLEFDHDKFYDWACRQVNPIFISEYWMPEDRFTCIAQKGKMANMSYHTHSNKREERIYVPTNQYESLFRKTILF